MEVARLRSLVLDLQAQLEATRRELAALSPSEVGGEACNPEILSAGRGETGSEDAGTPASASHISGQVERGSLGGSIRTEECVSFSSHLLELQAGAPKFDGNAKRFDIWSMRFQGYCSMHRVFVAFEGHEDIPVGKALNDPDVASRFSKVDLDRAVGAWSILTASISDEDLLCEVFLCGSPSKAWTMLNDRFAPRTPAQMMRFEKKFQSLSMTPGTNPHVFLSKVKRVAHRLAELGCPRSETLVCLRFLDGLPEEYDMVRTILLVNHQSTLTEQDVRWAVGSRYDLILMDQESSSLSPRTLNDLVSRQGEKRERVVAASRHVARRAGGTGVVEEKGSKTGDGQGRERNDGRGKPRRKCFRCGAKNHVVADCQAKVFHHHSQVDPEDS